MRRYFDGRRWTDHTASSRAAGAGTAPGAAARRRRRRRRRAHRVADRQPLLLDDILVEFDWPIAVYTAISVVVGYGPSVGWCRYASRRWGSGDRRPTSGCAAVVRPRLGSARLARRARRAARLVLVVELLGIPLSSNTEGIGELDVDRTYVISLLVTAVVAAPIVEELVFRGLMLRGLLSRMPSVAAVTLQAALFGPPTSTPCAARATSAWRSSSPPSASRSAAPPTCCAGSGRRSSPTPSSTPS